MITRELKLGRQEKGKDCLASFSSPNVGKKHLAWCSRAEAKDLRLSSLTTSNYFLCGHQFSLPHFLFSVSIKAPFTDVFKMKKYTKVLGEFISYKISHKENKLTCCCVCTNDSKYLIITVLKSFTRSFCGT